MRIIKDERRGRHRLLLLAVTGALAISGCAAAGEPTAGRPAGPASASVATGPVHPVDVPVSPTATAPARVPARPARPASTPCTSNRRAQYIFVSLRRQQMWMCAKRQVAYTTPITSGMSGADTETPTGTFHIQGRNRDSVLTLSSGETYDVKYWIPFQAPLFGFHDSSWQRFPYGSAAYRTAGSHGCVHMPLKAIKFLYAWVDIGATVRIKA